MKVQQLTIRFGSLGILIVLPSSVLYDLVSAFLSESFELFPELFPHAANTRLRQLIIISHSSLLSDNDYQFRY